MLTKFKSFPRSVQAAIVFLSIIIPAGVIAAPGIMIPILILIGSIGSVIRLLAYFLHGD